MLVRPQSSGFSKYRRVITEKNTSWPIFHESFLKDVHFVKHKQDSYPPCKTTSSLTEFPPHPRSAHTEVNNNVFWFFDMQFITAVVEDIRQFFCVERIVLQRREYSDTDKIIPLPQGQAWDLKSTSPCPALLSVDYPVLLKAG
jgi:hypothetical protein